MAKRKDGIFSFFSTKKIQEPTIKKAPTIPPDFLADKRENAATGDASWTPGRVVLGDYLVVKPLGEGGMGEVFLVKSQSTGQQFAVKRAKFQDRKSRNQFLKELHTWIDLPKHDNLVAFRFFRTVGNEIVIFSEYAPYGSLKDWIEDKKLYEGNEQEILKRILDISIQFAWGLKTAHEKGLVHQDVKPGNVLLGTGDAVKVNGVRANDKPEKVDTVIKVSDFGLTRAKAAVGEIITFNSQHKATATHAGAYTPAYCSPEQKKGQKLSHKTDIWSWALSVLTMFKGDATWPAGEYAPLVLQEYLESGPIDSSIPRMPQALTDLLERCFKKEDARPESMSEIVEGSEAFEGLKTIYEDECGEQYNRREPRAEGWDDQRTQRAIIHDRRTETGVQWTDPREWLDKICEATGRDRKEIEEQLPPRTGSRRAQAIADLAAFEEVRSLLEELISEGRENLKSHLATLLVDQALVYEQLRDLPGAIATQDRAIQIYEHLINQEGKKKLRKELAIAYLRKAITVSTMGDLKGSTNQLDKAIELYEHLVYQEGQIELASDLALAYMDKADIVEHLGDLKSAVSLSDKAIEIHRQFSGKEQPRLLANAPARAYVNKARAVMFLGECDMAVSLYDEAIERLEHLVHKQGREEFLFDLAMTYGNKALALENAEKHEDALGLHNKAKELFEALAYDKGHTEYLNELAAVYVNKANTVFMLKDFDSAVELCDKAIDIRERLVYQEGHTELHGRLAMCYVVKANAIAGLGKYDEAMELQDRAITVYESLVEDGQTELTEDLARVYGNKAATATSYRDYEIALEFYGKAIEIQEILVSQGRREIATVLVRSHLHKADALEKGNDPKAAAEEYVRAIEVMRSEVSTDQAKKLISQLTNFDHMALVRGEAKNLSNFAKAYDRGINILEHFNEERDEWPDLAQELVAKYLQKAHALKQSDNLHEELALYGKAILLCRRLASQDRHQDMIGTLFEVYVAKATAFVDKAETTKSDFLAALPSCNKAIHIYENQLPAEKKEKFVEAIEKIREVKKIAMGCC